MDVRYGPSQNAWEENPGMAPRREYVPGDTGAERPGRPFDRRRPRVREKHLHERVRPHPQDAAETGRSFAIPGRGTHFPDRIRKTPGTQEDKTTSLQKQSA